MYTQCPECSTAFRVTAEVLRQAAGKVRCGGCGNAFNALEHLSEEKPASRPAAPEHEPEPRLPELKPDPGEAAEDRMPSRMSPEQSAALLKTLDELAGSDIQLEDTGIEWRLLDEGDTDKPDSVSLDHEFAAPRPSLLDAELSADLESRRVDEVLSSSPTPVDELLTAAGDAAIDSPEVFDAAASETVPDEELRFDDNTGLPDDYDVEESGERPLVVPEASQDAPEPMANLQVDLGFDDPDEWQDLLEEVGPEDDAAAPAKQEMTLAEELEAIEISDIDDDGTPPSDHELTSQMEALSLELTGIQEELDGLTDEDAEPSIIDELAAIEIDTDEDADDERSATVTVADDGEVLASGDDDDADIEAADSLEESEAIVLEATLPDDDETGDIELGDGDSSSAIEDDEPDLDTDDSLEEGEAIVLEAALPGDDDVSNRDFGELAESDLSGVDADDVDDDSAAIELSALGTGAGDEDAEADEDIDAVDLSGLEDMEAEEHDIDADALELELELDVETADEDDANLELALDGDTYDVADDADATTSIDDDLFAAAFETEAGIKRGEPAEAVIEPLSEEEQTINMMIDQDLLSIAVTDEEGLASTIVGTKESFDAAIAETGEQSTRDASFPTDGPVETIIMSGENAAPLREAERAEALKEEAAAMIAAAKAEEAAQKKTTVDWRMVAGVVALGLLLAAQAIHFSRDALARVPVIHDILAPIYDTIGRPLTPAWQVTGWRVEKTKGSVDASGEALNIYTEVGNQADTAMPYPVIGVSLLDRFEESIGSRVFEPGEYLAGNVDRLAMVGKGQRFSAEMTIESPTVAASGFRLNVCYRLPGSRLRCAIEDFR